MPTSSNTPSNHGSAFANIGDDPLRHHPVVVVFRRQKQARFYEHGLRKLQLAYSATLIVRVSDGRVLKSSPEWQHRWKPGRHIAKALRGNPDAIIDHIHTPFVKHALAA